MNKDKTTAIIATANHSAHIGILALSRGNFIICPPAIPNLLPIHLQIPYLPRLMQH